MTGSIRDDFDRIALAIEATAVPDRLQPYERALIDLVPPGGRVLEVGCGHGPLTRAVAATAKSVVALDLSPQMIRVARQRSAGMGNIEYRAADILSAALPNAAFDVVLCVATLHHLPACSVLPRLAMFVRPGGVLAVQDLIERRRIRDLPINALARIVRWLRGTWPESSELSALYREHGRGERYLTSGEVKRMYRNVLPGARVLLHLEWRYTAIWRCP